MLLFITFVLYFFDENRNKNLNEKKKVQYGINREAAKISALLSDKTEKYEQLAGKEIITT